MKIGVIGTGSMGSVIIHKLRAANHELKIANSRGAESLKDFAAKEGVKAVDVAEVVKDVEVVFLVIPNKNLSELPKGLFEHVKPGTVVVDALNYYPYRDGKIDELENGMIESEWVSQLINYPVVKSFNTMFAHSMIRNAPSQSGQRIALPISGDESASKEIVAKIIDSVGYDPVDVGNIAQSWTLQPGSPIYCTDLTKEEILKWYPRTKQNLLAERREQLVQLYFTWPKDVTLEEQLTKARSIFQDGLV